MLELDRETAQPGDTLELTIENLTSTRWEYGAAYRLEHRTDDGWRWVNRDEAFILLLKVLEPRAQRPRGDRTPVTISSRAATGS